MLVDQHAAHERVRLENLVAGKEKKKPKRLQSAKHLGPCFFKLDSLDFGKRKAV